jgi:hypothetical protein
VSAPPPEAVPPDAVEPEPEPDAVEPEAHETALAEVPDQPKDGWLTRAIAVPLMPFVAVWEMGARAIESVRAMFRLIGRGFGWPVRVIGRWLRAVRTFADRALGPIGGLLIAPFRLLACAARYVTSAVGSFLARLSHPYRWLRSRALAIARRVHRSARTLGQLLVWPGQLVLSVLKTVLDAITWTLSQFRHGAATCVQALAGLLLHPYRWLRSMILAVTHTLERGLQAVWRLLAAPARIVRAGLNAVLSAMSWAVALAGRAFDAFVNALGSLVGLLMRPYRWVRRLVLALAQRIEWGARALLRLLAAPARLLLAGGRAVVEPISWLLTRLGRLLTRFGRGIDAFLRAIGSPLHLAFRWFWTGVRFVGRQARRAASSTAALARATRTRVAAAGRLVVRQFSGPWWALRRGEAAIRRRLREVRQTLRASVRNARTQVREAVRSAVGRRD